MTMLHAEPLPPMPSLARSEIRGDRWLLLLAIVVAGYILFGRGFAYLGVAPAFIGEITIGLGVLCFLMMQTWRRVMRMSLTWLLLAMIGLALLRTLPYLGAHGVDAIRDFMLMGYAAVALLVAGIIMDRPERLAMLLRWYRLAGPWIVVGVPLVWIVQQVIGVEVPFPVLGHNVLDVKAGDGQVHLAGIFAFWCGGLAGSLPWWPIAAMSVGVPAMGTINRGGLVSFGLVACICLAARPRASALRNLVIIGLFIGSMALAADVTVKVPGHERQLSAQQLLANVASVFGGSADRSQLHGTKEWRLAWWHTIIDYTVFGDRFWTGKGFGVNLADADGFQVNEDNSLRSPHNGHLTVLARAGVPGLAIWTAVHLAWLGMMANGWWTSRLRGDTRWNGLFLFLGAYASAFLLNASFDVFLEGPMAAIPFWTVIGTGIAATWCYRHRPDVLDSADA